LFEGYKKYGLNLEINNKRIFENVNFSIFSGKIHALIGINGCGKSSIANVLMGLDKQTHGEIYLKNKEISNLSISERANNGLTLAWQEPIRFEGISVKQYLELPRKTHNIKEIRKALESVGLIPDRYLDRMVDKTLSGGERKRIELASVLLMKPEVAILDEIDSGVDFIGIDLVLDSIKVIAKNGSVLLITHQDEFLKIADAATLICNGRVLRTGPPQEISKFYKYECSFCKDEEQPNKALEELLNVNK